MKVTSFGEVLWDDFPDGKRLGGAPLNLVSRLRSFGADAAIISRVGDDEDGKELVRQVAAKQVATDWIQTDTEQATSLVKVILSASGSASASARSTSALPLTTPPRPAVRPRSVRR